MTGAPKSRTASHPGEILSKEFMIPLGISASQLAFHTGLTEGSIEGIILGKQRVEAVEAVAFAHRFGTTPEFWLRLQKIYDQSIATRETEPMIKIRDVASLIVALANVARDARDLLDGGGGVRAKLARARLRSSLATLDAMEAQISTGTVVGDEP